MPELSRSQIALYGLIAIAVIAIGYRSLHGGGGGSSPGAVPGAASGARTGSGSAGAGEASGSGGAFGLQHAGGGGLTVDVAGAVRRPGVYRLPAGSRVLDAIEKAGGETGRSIPGGINRAARIADGQQVIVPGRAVAGSGAGGAGGSAAAGAPGPGAEAPISIGTATAEQLETIDGIGPVTAADIIEFRDSHGGLSSVDQLDQVSGIGPVTMEALRSRLQP